MIVPEFSVVRGHVSSDDGAESDGDEYTPVDLPLGMKTGWTLPIIQAYLLSHDFSFVTIWAMSHLDPFNAERHLNLLSAATHIAVEARVLEGISAHCGACKMFLWAHTHTQLPDPWLCEWCQRDKARKTSSPLSLEVVVVEGTAAPQESIRDFFGLVLHLNGEQDFSNLMESTISKRYNYQEMTLDGLKWTPTPTFLSGLSWPKATQL